MAIVVLSGALANKPLNGGEAWVRLSWLFGLKKLGFETWLLEEVRREACINAAGERVPFRDSANLAFFRQVTGDFGLAGSAALLCDGGEQTYGAVLKDLQDLAGAADLLRRPRRCSSASAARPTLTSTPASRSSGTPPATPARA